MADIRKTPQDASKLLDGLYEIVGDLWKDSQQKLASTTEELRNAPSPVPEVPKAMEPAVKAPQAAKADAKRGTPEDPVLPSFELLWKSADESIEWTDVLVSEKPVYGAARPELWGYLREHVEGVLAGSVRDYADVLRTVRPLDDLKSFAKHIRVEVVSSDCLKVSFDALDSDIESARTEAKRYVAGLTLRCTRDLMAILPIREVDVDARYQDRTVVSGKLDRRTLMQRIQDSQDPVGILEEMKLTVGF